MGNADQKNIPLKEPMDGPSRRMRAILEERVQLPAEVGQPAERSVRRPGRKKLRQAPLNAADFRLQAVQQHRTAVAAMGKTQSVPGIENVALRDALPGPADLGGYWLPLGPFGVRKGQATGDPVISGRVSRIALSPDGKRVYLATANSGVWRSSDQGRNWQPLMGPDFDQNPIFRASDSLACGAIAVVSNPLTGGDDVYVGTGEGDSGDFDFNAVPVGVGSGQGQGYFGVGPIFLEDGHTDWVTEPVEPGTPSLSGQAFFGMAVHPSQSALVIAATSQGVYKRAPVSLAVSPTGFSWTQLTQFNGPAGVFTPNFCTSVAVASRPGGLTFFAAITGGVYQSTDDGAHWSLVGAGFPALPWIVNQKFRIAVKHDDANVVYAQIPALGPTPKFGQLLGLYRWEAGDNNWHKVEGVPERLFGPDPEKGGQGNYDNAITVDPNNGNRLFIGGSTAATDGEGFLGSGPWSASLYRCLVTVNRQAAVVTGVSASATFVGGGVHADVHDLVFPPGNSRELWIGCDGGVFHSSSNDGLGIIFQSRNHGLQTLCMNNMALHPTAESVLFSGTQDNGGLQSSGTQEWIVATLGDCGSFVVNWHDPSKVLNTYTNNALNRSTQYGNRDTYSRGGPSLEKGETSLFYAPLVGTPAGVGGASAADHVAFGSERLWLSENFGKSWRSLPSGKRATDSTGSSIRAIAFASPTKIYAGNEAGAVFRYEKKNNQWQQDPMVDAAHPLPGNRITCIAIDPADASGDSIYITIGGILGNENHVWKGTFTAGPPVSTSWTSMGGVTAGKKLPDVHHSTLVVDPVSKFLYAGADIGVWVSKNTAPLEWEPFSQGLPDAAALDLKLRGKRLLVSTHGRGIFERRLDNVGVPIQTRLFLRNTVLDSGERDIANPESLKNPLNPDENISLLASPDIRIEAPNADGSFRSPTAVDSIEFNELLRDDTERIPTHASAQVRSRVYVRVHNKGIAATDAVQVMLLVAPSTNSLPPLPPQLADAVAQGQMFNTATWKTVGIQSVKGLRVGQPQILTFELPASLLPPPDQVSGDTRCCLLAVLHHADDPYKAIQLPDASFETNVKKIATQQRHVALRQIKIVKFEGTPPPLFPYRPLPGFTAIPESATAPNAPFDAILGAALKRNDDFFENTLRRVLNAPLPNFPDDDGTPLDPERITFGSEIVISSDVVAGNGPLIWCAQKSITVKALIDASGKGAAARQPGDFGGSGGGGGTNSAHFGGPCLVPVSGVTLLPEADGQKDGHPATEVTASRALACLTLAKGGGGGGSNTINDGGAGGGVVVLCAPLIKFEGPGKIDASGKPGTAAGGGGGGGLVILIANEFDKVHEDVNVKVDGGAKGNNAGVGGKGFILKKSYS